MNEVAFIESRAPDWKRLSILIEKADVSPKNLKAHELEELIRLYRRCSTDLALVRTRSNNLQVIGFLNDLTARCYSAIYRPKRKPVGKAIGASVVLAAQTVRRMKWFIFTSAFTFILGVLFAFWATGASPALHQKMVPDQFKDLFDTWKAGEFPDSNFDRSTTMTGFYASHNPQVSIMTSAVGAGTFGAGSAISLWQNGVMLGALAYEMNTVHKLPFLFASIMPHGVTELSGMTISGAAGYQLGWALIAPGRRKRRDALRDAGKDAIVLLCVSVIMMFMAAPVEGFISYNANIPLGAKVGFAVTVAIAWTIFWLGYGREQQPLAEA
jgi:uncharacterized membrane protein SpoIIM required for sporulation